MGQVRVTFVGLIRNAVGASETVLTLPAGVTVGGMVGELSDRFGPAFAEHILCDGELAPHASLVIDGRYVRELGGSEPVVTEQGPRDVEVVLLGPPAAGG